MSHHARAALCSLLTVALLLGWIRAAAPTKSWAEDLATGTATITLTPTATATLSPSPTATSTSTATPTATPTPTISPTPRGRRRPLPVIAPTTTPTPMSEPAAPAVSTATPTRTPTSATPIPRPHHPPPAATGHASRPHHKTRSAQHQTKPKRKRRAKRKPTPTPTATPSVTLQTDNTIVPVVCHGPLKPDATQPFLYPPYHGWTSIVSYFDHDMPTYYQDGLIIAANGLEARPDDIHTASDFPAYWNGGLRQFVYYDGHNGYDFDLSYRPVYAAAAGTVMFARMEYPGFPHLGYGNMILINHHNGYITLYGHFSTLLVKKGERVKRGQIIGISGNTGHSSGPHLHFTLLHNCTPTDPYGWTGPGPDPLAQYQGEASTYLWVRQPLITNPLPGWPGIATLPGTTNERLLLLRLPAVGRGTGAFTRALRAEARRVQRALGLPPETVKMDLLRGAIDVTAPLPPAQLYTLPDVVSIGSLDAASPARADVLAALARAALISPPPGARLARTPHWSGYLLRWQGQTVLLGRGTKTRQLSVRLTRGKRVLAFRSIIADPHSGAYAIDLGKLSPLEMRDLERALTRKPRKRSAVSVSEVAPPRPSKVARPTTLVRQETRAAQSYLVIPIVVLVVLGALAAAFTAVRRRPVRP